MTEVNLAIEGYWRNWERRTAWLMREIVFELINGNPHITGTKPENSRRIFPITDDREAVEKMKDEARRPTKEEIDEAGKLLKGLRDNMKTNELV